MLLDYPRFNDESAIRSFEDCKPPLCWSGYNDRLRKGPRTLADALSADKSNGPAYETAISTGLVSVDLDDLTFRRPVTGRRQWVTGSYASPKTGRSNQYECMNEAVFIKHSEVDPGVIDFRSQPAQIRFPLGNRTRIYTPDFMRLLQGGTIEVVEVKSNILALNSNKGYLEKLNRVSEICKKLGWKFSVYYGEEFRASNVFNFNINALYQNLNHTVYPAEISAAIRIIEASGGTAHAADLVSIWGAQQLGIASLLKLIGRGVLVTDLSKKLSIYSLISKGRS